MTPRKPADKRQRTRQRHGLTPAKRALRDWGERAIDGRTRAGRTLAAWRGSLIDDLGGEDRVSAQQLTVLELAARTKVLLDGIDAWLFDNSLVNKRDRRLFAVVKERQQLADSLARYMSLLGLERRATVYDLDDYVVERYGDAAEPPEAASG